MRCKSFIICDYYYIELHLLLFLVIFRDSLSGSEDFVLSDSLYGALFANVSALFQCCAYIKFASSDGNIATVRFDRNPLLINFYKHTNRCS